MTSNVMDLAHLHLTSNFDNSPSTHFSLNCMCPITKIWIAEVIFTNLGK